MNLRYYLRGLGIGIIVTAIIMGFTSRKAGTVTPANEQVQAEAGEQTEKGGRVLADLETGPAAEVNEDVPAVLPEAEEQKAQETEAPEPEEEQNPEEDRDELLPENAGEEENGSDPEEKESIIIEVSEGDSSYTVSMKLEEAGLIASASAFDRYLYDNGYDRKLRFGTYEIPVDIDPEEIAEILAGNRR